MVQGGLAGCSPAAGHRRPCREACVSRGRIRVVLAAILAGRLACGCPDDGDGSASWAGTFVAVEGVQAAAEARDVGHR
jgi:hypothetical protein